MLVGYQCGARQEKKKERGGEYWLVRFTDGAEILKKRKKKKKGVGESTHAMRRPNTSILIRPSGRCCLLNSWSINNHIFRYSGKKKWHMEGWRSWRQRGRQVGWYMGVGGGGTYILNIYLSDLLKKHLNDWLVQVQGTHLWLIFSNRSSSSHYLAAGGCWHRSLPAGRGHWWGPVPPGWPEDCPRSAGDMPWKRR